MFNRLRNRYLHCPDLFGLGSDIEDALTKDDASIYLKNFIFDGRIHATAGQVR